MNQNKCNFCGNENYEKRKITYLYSHSGNYMIVPNMPVEVCGNCGMVYYEASVLKEVERQFFAIQSNAEEPDRYIEVPEKAYS